MRKRALTYPAGQPADRDPLEERPRFVPPHTPSHCTPDSKSKRRTCSQHSYRCSRDDAKLQPLHLESAIHEIFFTHFLRTLVINTTDYLDTLKSALPNFPDAPNRQSERQLVPKQSLWVPSLHAGKALSQGVVRFPALCPHCKEDVIFYGKRLSWKTFACTFFLMKSIWQL